MVLSGSLLAENRICRLPDISISAPQQCAHYLHFMCLSVAPILEVPSLPLGAKATQNDRNVVHVQTMMHDTLLEIVVEVALTQRPHI